MQNHQHQCINTLLTLQCPKNTHTICKYISHWTSVCVCKRHENSYPSCSSKFIDGPGIGTFMPAPCDWTNSCRGSKNKQMPSCSEVKDCLPKKPVSRVSGANIIVTTANRCMMMFMTYPCKHTLRNKRMVGWDGAPHLFRHAEIDHGKAAVL